LETDMSIIVAYCFDWAAKFGIDWQERSYRMLGSHVQASHTWGRDKAYLCISQTRSFVRSTVQSSHSFIIASMDERLPSTMPDATLRATFRTAGRFSNCFTIRLPRLLYKYWLMAAWVVDNFSAAATCE